MKVSDAFSIRTNLSESTVWLAIIFSWLTPYPWYADLGIAVMVMYWNLSVVRKMRVEDPDC